MMSAELKIILNKTEQFYKKIPKTGAERSKTYRERLKSDEHLYDKHKMMARIRVKDYRKRIQKKLKMDENLRNEHRERERIRKRILRAKKRATEGGYIRPYKRKLESGIDHLSEWIWNEKCDAKNGIGSMPDTFIEGKQEQVHFEASENYEFCELNTDKKSNKDPSDELKKRDRIRAKEYRKKIKMQFNKDEGLLIAHREKDKIRKRMQRAKNNRNENRCTRKYIRKAKSGPENLDEWNWMEINNKQTIFDNIETLDFCEPDFELDEEERLDKNYRMHCLSEAIVETKNKQLNFKQKENYRLCEPKIEVKEVPICCEKGNK